MTETEQQIALAQWAGWNTIPKVLGSVYVYYKEGDPHCHAALPNTSSLDVLHEMEKRLTPEQEEDYVEELKGLIMSDAYEDEPRYNKSNLSSCDSTYRCTASQRRIALLKTLNLWKEDV